MPSCRNFAHNIVIRKWTYNITWRFAEMFISCVCLTCQPNVLTCKKTWDTSSALQTCNSNGFNVLLPLPYLLPEGKSLSFKHFRKKRIVEKLRVRESNITWQHLLAGGSRGSNGSCNAITNAVASCTCDSQFLQEQRQCRLLHTPISLQVLRLPTSNFLAALSRCWPTGARWWRGAMRNAAATRLA